MSEIHGRGGRVIVVDETRAAELNTALIHLPHTREAEATQPMVLPVLPTPRTSLGDRVADWIEAHGLITLAAFAAVGLGFLFALGMVRHVG